MLLRTLALFAPIAVLTASSGCGGRSSSPATQTPAQFAAEAGKVCVVIAPRLKQTSSAITTLDKRAGSALGKLPRLAGLLGELDAEFADLHRGLSAIRASDAQKVAFAAFLADLDRLEMLTKQGTAFLAPGTIRGLRQFKALAPRLNAATAALGSDAMKVPGLSACNNLA